MDQNTGQIHKDGRHRMCEQHDVRTTTRDNIEQNTDKAHIYSPRIEIKISYPSGNRTRSARLEGRDSTDYGKATDLIPTLIKSRGWVDPVPDPIRPEKLTLTLLKILDC